MRHVCPTCTRDKLYSMQRGILVVNNKLPIPAQLRAEFWNVLQISNQISTSLLTPVVITDKNIQRQNFFSTWICLTIITRRSQLNLTDVTLYPQPFFVIPLKSGISSPAIH